MVTNVFFTVSHFEYCTYSQLAKLSFKACNVFIDAYSCLVVYWSFLKYRLDNYRQISIDWMQTTFQINKIKDGFTTDDTN